MNNPLAGFANAYSHQLSSGMTQRAALARALVNDPMNLILDERVTDISERRRAQENIVADATMIPSHRPRPVLRARPRIRPVDSGTSHRTLSSSPRDQREN